MLRWAIKMGYRSDVRIITSVKGFSELSKFVNSYLQEKKLGEEYNLLKDTDVYTANNFEVYFGWNEIKWYMGYAEIDAIDRGLDKLVELGLSYRFAEIGESDDDIRSEVIDGDKDVPQLLDYIGIIRRFDDEAFVSDE